MLYVKTGELTVENVGLLYRVTVNYVTFLKWCNTKMIMLL